MKILHLYSDWKWTGPAEPVLQMCRALQDLGHECLLAHRADQFELDETIAGKASVLGINRTEGFALDRYVHPGGTLRDLWSLPRFIRRERFDVVHMHLSHDHALGGICALLTGRRRPLLVRTLHRRNVLRDSLGNRFLLKAFTDSCLVFTERFRQGYIDRFGILPDTVGVQPMTIDLDRFSPTREFDDMRPAYDIPADAPVIGIVGRYQSYRRADVFLEAAARLLEREPRARFLVIGRSSQMPKTVIEPMRRLGLEKNVVLPGYLVEGYDATLACMDVFSLLMPGFDGTARAVREAMALGLPCVVSDYGMLPEIVTDGDSGLVVPMDPDALAEAWLQLVRSPERKRELGQAARQRAEQHFRIDHVGPCLTDFYSEQLERRRGTADPG